MLPPFLVKNVVYPLHEKLVGRKTLRFLEELEESQWWSPAELHRAQEQKLTALVRHAARNTPFYRRRFLAAGINVDAPNLLENLERFPLLTKEDIREHVSDMLWHSAPGGLYSHNTGGSTGEPLHFYIDRRRQAFDQAARIRSHRWFGVDIGDHELMLWGSPIEFQRTDQIKRARDLLVNQGLISAFDMSPDQMDRYIEVWNRFRPSCLFGYPSSIALFADHVKSCNRKLETTGLKAVFVTGEVCLPHHRESILSIFDVPVADGYGSREAGFIAHQCPSGRMHITAENVIVEIVENERVQPCGQSGEIVITHLDAYGMPFIRYRTGDIGRLSDEQCPCGRGLPVMDVVQGRSTDFLRLPDGTTRHALSIIYPLRSLPTIREFRVTQNEDYSVTIDIVPAEITDPHDVETIADAVRPVLGNEISLTIQYVEALAPQASGKHRHVLSHVTA